MPVRKRVGGSTDAKPAASPAKKPRTKRVVNEPHQANESTQASKDQEWVYPSLLENKGLAEEMVLSHVIRAHSLATHDGQDDEEQDTAACAFEPTIKSKQKPDQADANDDRNNSTPKSSTIVATCGGNTVCLIDCQLGRIFAKYTHVEEEEFQCLAWTTLEQDVGDENVAAGEGDSGEDEDSDEDGNTSKKTRQIQSQVNILAVAGRLGSIKLINPLQNSCYDYLHGHTAEIVQLKFSLNNPQWLYSASADATVRLWDIGSLKKDGKEPRCLAKLVGLDSPVTAMAVSEKYLVVGTEAGHMARFNIRLLERQVSTRQSFSLAVVQCKPDRVFPNSQEWHESPVDDIVYLPKFSSKSFFSDDKDNKSRKAISGPKSKAKGGKKSTTAATATSKGGKTLEATAPPVRRGRGRPPKKKVSEDERSDSSGEEEEEEEGSDNDSDDDDTEYIFASHESLQGEILIWDATNSTEMDAELKTILEWPIAESRTKFAFAQNVAGRHQSKSRTSPSQDGERRRPRQNVLLVGSTTGEVLLYDLDKKPRRAKGNIVAQKPARILSSPMSTQLLRDITVSEDLSTIVAGDWTNRVLVWKYPSYLDA